MRNSLPGTNAKTERYYKQRGYTEQQDQNSDFREQTQKPKGIISRGGIQKVKERIAKIELHNKNVNGISK